MTLLFIILGSLLGSMGCVLVAGLFWWRSGEFTPRTKMAVLSYATGTLLGAAFLGMLPHVLEHLPVRTGLGVVLAGVVGLFLLEKMLIWRHCHEPGCQAHAQTGPLILIGAAGHNLIDGVAIAVAFLQSAQLGWAASLAIIAHEIPHKIGDVMVLVHSGYAKNRALGLIALASLTTLFGAVGTYGARAWMAAFAPHALAVSAASFIYIALADLTPDHRMHPRMRDTLVQMTGIGAGIATILLVTRLAH